MSLSFSLRHSNKVCKSYGVKTAKKLPEICFFKFDQKFFFGRVPNLQTLFLDDDRWWWWWWWWLLHNLCKWIWTTFKVPVSRYLKKISSCLGNFAEVRSKNYTEMITNWLLLTLVLLRGKPSRFFKIIICFWEHWNHRSNSPQILFHLCVINISPVMLRHLLPAGSKILHHKSFMLYLLTPTKIHIK